LEVGGLGVLNCLVSLDHTKRFHISTFSHIHIAPYDPYWRREFDDLFLVLSQALQSVKVDIQHVESTAVPGLAAKPVRREGYVAGGLYKKKDLIHS
jgi:hypothetical protein